MGLFGFNTKKKTADQEVPAEVKTTEEILEEEKEDMIQGVEELSTTSVKEVMIPRIDVDFINIETEQNELLEKITESGHSRFPPFYKAWIIYNPSPFSGLQGFDW